MKNVYQFTVTLTHSRNDCAREGQIYIGAFVLYTHFSRCCFVQKVYYLECQLFGKSQMLGIGIYAQ